MSDIEVTVRSTDKWNLGSPGTSICLYIGYSDVEVNKIEILKPKPQGKPHGLSNSNLTEFQ